MLEWLVGLVGKSIAPVKNNERRVGEQPSAGMGQALIVMPILSVGREASAFPMSTTVKNVRVRAIDKMIE